MRPWLILFEKVPKASLFRWRWWWSCLSPTESWQLRRCSSSRCRAAASHQGQHLGTPGTRRSGRRNRRRESGPGRRGFDPSWPSSAGRGPQVKNVCLWLLYQGYHKKWPWLKIPICRNHQKINLYLKTLELLQALIVLRQELVKLVHSSTKTVALNNCWLLTTVAIPLRQR